MLALRAFADEEVALHSVLSELAAAKPDAILLDLRGNVGGGGSDFSAGLQVDFRRRFASGNTLDIGYRALDIDYENDSGLAAIGLDLSMQGLAIGYTFDL